mmetsp:Transcript_25543/g.44561  ORF Transcript_25543/g.44561 Transcript_25543/m.44561 type:complete len:190 (+) Transcript_25543:6323-6892(+)
MEEEKLQVPIVEKSKGAEFFKNGDFEEASKCYSKALLAFNYLFKQMMFESEEQLKNYITDIQLPCLLNLAACYLKLNYGYENVVTHCTDALKISPNNIKALYRRGIAYTHLSEYELAGKDLIAASKEEPNNPTIKQAWEELRKRKQHYKDKLKRIAQVTFPTARAAPPPKKTWLEMVKGLAMICRSRFY